jgi:hypothetical protein
MTCPRLWSDAYGRIGQRYGPLLRGRALSLGRDGRAGQDRLWGGLAGTPENCEAGQLDLTECLTVFSICDTGEIPRCAVPVIVRAVGRTRLSEAGPIRTILDHLKLDQYSDFIL